MKKFDASFLREEPVFWSRLGFCYDPPRFDQHGELIRLFSSFEELERQHKNMYDAGIKLHSGILFSGWYGVDKFDYSMTDRTLQSIFSCGKDIQYIPRIKLNVPLDWCEKYPEDLCVYEDGPRESQAVRKLVNTPQHDILGYNTPIGYTVPNGVFTDDRPNMNGLIALQSISSERWLLDAADALRRLIIHIKEETPYGDRIPAWHIAYGPCGETSVWGQWCYAPAPGMDSKRRCADYGINHTANFFNWCIKKYGNIDAVRQAWQMPELTENNFTVPSGKLREDDNRTLTGLFRKAKINQSCVDYELFMMECQITALNHFGKVTHQYSGNCAGAFAGYFIDVPRTSYSGNGSGEVLKQADEIDFFAAPKSYFYNGIGESGGEQAPAQSVNLYKVWMDEIDNGTHLDFARSQCENFADSRYLMWREVAKDLAHDSGFWWMDLGNNWYDDPELLAEISRIGNTAKKIMAQPHKSTAEILLIADDAPLTAMKVNLEVHEKLFTRSIRQAQLIGAPVDIYRMKDLEMLDCRNYKMVCFLNPFILNEELMTLIGQKLGNTLKIWQYAPGIIAGKELLPFDYELLPEKSEAFYPEFAVDGRKELFRCGKDIYAPVPEIPAVTLRELAESCGCSFDAPCGNVVYGDNRFRAIFRGQEVCRIIPQKCWAHDAVSAGVPQSEYVLTKRSDFLFLCCN